MSSNSSQQGSPHLPELLAQKIDVVVKRTFIDMPVSPNKTQARRASLPASLERISPSRELEILMASRRGSISDVSTDLQDDLHIDECEQKLCDKQLTPKAHSNDVVTQWPTNPYPPQPQILSTSFNPVCVAPHMQLQSTAGMEQHESPRRYHPVPANYDAQWQSINNGALDTSMSPSRRPPTTGSYHMHLQSVGKAVLDNSSSPRRRSFKGNDRQWQHYAGNTSTENSMSPRRRHPGAGAAMRWQTPVNSDMEKSVSPQRRTALSSKAQAWQPTPPAQNPRFNNQAADVMAKLEVALLSGDWEVDVVIKKDANSFTVSVSMKEDELGNWTQVMTEAQEVLLRAAKESSCVYVLGYDSEPFQLLQNGFMATLGEMRDEAAACWDIYGLGACPSGNQCARAHPHSLAYVVLQLVE